MLSRVVPLVPHALGLALLSPAAMAQDLFSIVALPDTQNYVNNVANAPLFTQQTQWVQDQIQNQGNPRNIVFVTHLGDLVSTGTDLTQWNRADVSMGVLDPGLDGVVPYGVLPGNHDFMVTGSKSTGTSNYLAFFGPQRFAGRSWYGGADPSGNNSYQVFSDGVRTFMHISLEWLPNVNVTDGPVRDPSPLEWAQDVLRAHPGVPTIMSTHEHLDDDPPGRAASGQSVWNQLIRKNDQIIMVLNGHYHSVGGFNDGEYHQVSQNDFGKDVIEALSDFQDYPNGGDGWLRIMTFDFDNDEVRFETFSPVLNQFQTETVAQVGPFASQFTIPMDFDVRFDFEDPPAPPIPPRPVYAETVFQQGVNGYAGTLDKEIRSSGGDAANGNGLEISVDGDDGSPGLQPNDALIRFEAFVGAGANQIPLATPIEQAVLSLNVTNPGSGFDLYEMAVGWDETTTWASFGGNGITPGVEAAPAPLYRVGENVNAEIVPAGPLDLDITSTAQGWIDGSANFGLGLRALVDGTNGIDFTSSESATPPALVVRTLLPGVSTRRFAQGVNGYAGAVDTQLLEGSPLSDQSGVVEFSVDANTGGGASHALIRFDSLFGAGGTGQLAPEDVIIRAFLRVHSDNPGAGADVHRLLQPFNATDTWASSFGGDGVQADGVEAATTLDTTVAGATGPVMIDVTPSLLAWRCDPASNFGWVLRPAGNDGWDIASSDNVVDLRPELIVFIDGCPADVAEDGTCDPGIKDGNVNLTDFACYLAEWSNGSAFADITGAGACEPGKGGDGVDLSDFGCYLSLWALGCP